MFCPFTKEECNPECIFNNGFGDSENDPSGCNLYEASNAIISFGFLNRTMEDYLKTIEENTGEDNTESFNIYSELSSIKSIVEEIKDKL